MSCLCLSYSQHCQLLAAMKQRLREGGLGAHGLSNLAWALSRWPGVEGAPGQQLSLHLLLRVVADVGIVGYPNAGEGRGKCENNSLNEV